MLAGPVTEKEIEKALSSMPPDKSPGLDGFSVSFFKTCWKIVKNEVISVVSYLFFSGKLRRFVNYVYLALVPKKPNASDMKDYRPISCCNVVYKLVSKVLANMLCLVLPSDDTRINVIINLV
ncbi:Transposon TX1 uncharacterized 149 kDa protein [Linum perenne]